METNQDVFLHKVLSEVGYTDPENCTSEQIVLIFESLKKHGCSHITMWDYLFQDGDYQILPIYFGFVNASVEDLTDERFIPIGSDYSKMALTLFLKDSGVYFVPELHDFKLFG